MDVYKTSMTLIWNEPPPILTGTPKRNITQYEVTLIPQDGGHTRLVLVPAEANAAYIVRDLAPGTAYDIKVYVVIDTETKGQGELTYDIGIPLFTITTGKQIIFMNVYVGNFLYLNFNRFC